MVKLALYKICKIRAFTDPHSLGQNRRFYSYMKEYVSAKTPILAYFMQCGELLFRSHSLSWRRLHIWLSIFWLKLTSFKRRSKKYCIFTFSLGKTFQDSMSQNCTNYKKYMRILCPTLISAHQTSEIGLSIYLHRFKYIFTLKFYGSFSNLLILTRVTTWMIIK